MGYNITNKGNMSLDTIRMIVDAEKPFDTGYLYSFGNRYNETPQYKRVIYDLLAVPYIQFLEEGTQRSKKHVGFISQNTITRINMGASSSDISALTDVQRDRNNMVSQGVLEHIKAFGQAGGRYDKFVGIT